MIHSKYLLAAAALLLSLSACKKGLDYDAMARDMCACMQPMYETKQKMEQLAAGGDTDALQSLMTELETRAGEAEKCAGELETKYGPIEGDASEEKAEAALAKACPEMAALVGEQE